jgi:hypothetical protein
VAQLRASTQYTIPSTAACSVRFTTPSNLRRLALGPLACGHLRRRLKKTEGEAAPHRAIHAFRQCPAPGQLKGVADGTSMCYEAFNQATPDT